jgi:uroporphyrinogen-III synthase
MHRSTLPFCLALLVACGDNFGSAPVLGDLALTTEEDTPIAVAFPVTALEADALGFTLVTEPSHGELSGDGPTWTYTPDADYVGEDTFTVRAENRHGSASATVTITVAPVNDAPVATDDSFAAVFDTPVTIAHAALLANDTDIDSETLTVSAFEAVTDGYGVPALGSEEVVITPEPGFEGAAAFTYTITDGELTADGMVTVTVGLNRVPVAEDDAAATDEDTPLVIEDAELLANDGDPDLQTLVISSVGNATNGTATHAGAQVTFVPEPDFVGEATFEYTITDQALTDVATVFVSVGSTNDAPVVTVSTASVTYVEDSAALAVDPAIGLADADSASLAAAAIQISTGCAGDQDVLALASPPEGVAVGAYDPESCTLALTGPASLADYQAALRLVSYQNTSQTPAVTPRVVRFTVDDGEAAGGSGSGTLDLVVTAVDDAPVAVNDAATVAEDATATAIAVLANDTDVDGGPISIESVTQPANGTVAVVGGTSLTYAPAHNYCNDALPADTFTYALAPGDGSATVSVTVTCTNDDPVAVDDSSTVLEDAAPTSIAVLANDTDVDGGSSTIASVTQPANGTVAIVGGTSLTYAPAPDYCNSAAAADQFSYELAPGGSAAVISMTVTCVADGPVAADDAATTDEDTTLVIGDATLLANDSDADQDTLVITAVGNATNGTVSHAGAQVTFVPDPDFTGTAGFQYTVGDPTLTAVAAVVVTVQSMNDPPVVTASSGSATYVENAAPIPVDADLALADADSASMASATIQITSGCASGEDVLALASPPAGITVGAYHAPSCTLALSGAASLASYQAGMRQVTYLDTSDAPATAARVVTFTVNDGQASNSTGSDARGLTVTALDDDPVAVNDAATVAEDAPATAIDVLGNDTDPDDGPMTISGVTQPDSGAVAIVDGTGLTYAPEPDYCNAPPGTTPDTFTYELAPGGSTAVVSVTVTCADDAPVAVDDVASVAGDSGANTISVLANDTDGDGGPMTVQAVTQPANGAVAIATDGLTVTYTPAPSYCNDLPNAPLDTFTYTLVGGSSATVTIDVGCVCGLNLPTDFVVASN